jgi:hypothetical protein
MDIEKISVHVAQVVDEESTKDYVLVLRDYARSHKRVAPSRH